MCAYPHDWAVKEHCKINHNDQPDFRSFTHLLMKNGERKDFMDAKESFDAAEEYLQSLGDQPFN
jgi:hypothetical protein